MMRFALWIAIAFGLCLLPVQAATVKDHPAVTAYPELIATRREDDGFRSYNLVVGVNDKGATDRNSCKRSLSKAMLRGLPMKTRKTVRPMKFSPIIAKGLRRQASRFSILASRSSADPPMPRADGRG